MTLENRISQISGEPSIFRSLRVLMYHDIAPPGSVSWRNDPCLLNVNPVSFEKQMHLLKRLGYRSISSRRLIAALDGQATLPPRSVMITFDDGYEGVYEYARPVLNRYGLGALVFIVPGYVGETAEWDRSMVDRPPDLMTWDHLRHLADQGFEFGSHTLNHVALSELDRNSMRVELCSSKQIIEAHLQQKIDLFAYPHSRLNEHAPAELAAAGYRAAFCGYELDNGFFEEGRYLLRRIPVQRTDNLLKFSLKLITGRNIFYEFKKFRQRFGSRSLKRSLAEARRRA